VARALQIRTMPNGSSWYWEIVSQDHEILACGVSDAHVDALLIKCKGGNLNRSSRNPTDVRGLVKLAKWSILISFRELVRVKWIEGDAQSAV
jgi:hypothetical protein